jgi:glycosyltransferase involved in cell wall biosynthesis
MQGDNYDVEALLRASVFFKDKNVDFYIAGSGEGKNYLLDEIVKNDLKNVFILGNLSAQKLARLYKFCDIGLALYGRGSNVDMPDKFYDYSSCGLAIIASLTGELKDVIVENNLGFYYEAGNYNDLIDKLSRLIESTDLLGSCKENSKSLGLTYSVEKQFKKLLLLIEKLNDEE